jgi:hypothetical protein
VYPYPGVVGQTIVSYPGGALADRDERVAFLPVRPNRSNELMEAGGVGTRRHGLDHHSPQPAALLISLDLGRKGRQSGGQASIPKCTQADGVETRRQISKGAIPSKRNRSAPSDDALQIAVVEEHLEVCKIGNQCTQDRRRVLAVLVVLRLHIEKELMCLLPEVRPLGRSEEIESRVWRKGLDVHLKILLRLPPRGGSTRRTDLSDPRSGLGSAVAGRHEL